MGCLCSKGYSKATNIHFVAPNDEDKGKDERKSMVHRGADDPQRLQDPEVVVGAGVLGHHQNIYNGHGHHFSSRGNKTELGIKSPCDSALPTNNATADDDDDLIKRSGHHKIVSVPHGAKSEVVAAGWPLWLASVAGEAIKGWAPRPSDSYEKLRKIGQGTYSSVYMARDPINDKIVAMKKVRFVKMDPGSIGFMAREICILRRLDHPNIMKLEALALSKVSGSLYLVFDYMEHDLSGLLASPRIKFTEPQIKCYMQQILRGLEYCHSHGVLHRDMKGANLLVDNKGNLKISDFGLATWFEPDQKRPLTSRVVTLWYRAPELLLGATDYGPAIDLWSTGCILAELFVGQPIMPGRTEVEQLHKILKLCGSPTEEYWMKVKASFKCKRMYKRRVAETFKEFPSSALALVQVLLSMDPQERGTASSALNSQFFTSNPLPCDPSSFPYYHPSKEMDVWIREAKAKKKNDRSSSTKADDGSRKKGIPVAIPEGEGQSNKNSGDGDYMYNSAGEDSMSMIASGFPRGNLSIARSNSTIYPNALSAAASSSTWNQNTKGDSDSRHLISSASCQHPQLQPHLSDYHPKDAAPARPRRIANNPSMSMGDGEKRQNIMFSGPLMPRSNLEDMLKEHERQIQEAVRKAKLGKVTTN